MEEDEERGEGRGSGEKKKKLSFHCVCRRRYKMFEFSAKMSNRIPEFKHSFPATIHYYKSTFPYPTDLTPIGPCPASRSAVHRAVDRLSVKIPSLRSFPLIQK